MCYRKRQRDRPATSLISTGGFGGLRTTLFVFEPDEYTGGRNRVIVAGEDIDPKTMSTIVVEKPSKGFTFASATWHFSTERLPPEARGNLFGVTCAIGVQGEL